MAIVGVGFSLWLWSAKGYLEGRLSHLRVERSVRVLRGWGTQRIVSELARAGIVRRPWTFRLYLVLSGRFRGIRPGYYCADREMTPKALAIALGSAQRCSVGIRAGDNVWRVAKRLESSRRGDVEGFLRAAGDFSLVRRLGIPLRPAGVGVKGLVAVEGYLEPGEHPVFRSEGPRELLRRLIGKRREKYSALVASSAPRAAALKRRFGFNLHELVILASLVEREALVDDERAVIAGVFLNRLAKGWKLQSDPTLVYRRRYFGQRPSPVHRRDKGNPYNTYAITGLPPGPICTPSLESVRAILHAKKSAYMFFVARGDGSRRHTFSATYEEHKQAVTRLRQRLQRP